MAACDSLLVRPKQQIVLRYIPPTSCTREQTEKELEVQSKLRAAHSRLSDDGLHRQHPLRHPPSSRGSDTLDTFHSSTGAGTDDGSDSGSQSTAR